MRLTMKRVVGMKAFDSIIFCRIHDVALDYFISFQHRNGNLNLLFFEDQTKLNKRVHPYNKQTISIQA
jgi:hypothetical protein